MGAKSNKYQICPYPSWISNERPVFASSFLVGHPKGARRQHWDELSFPPFFIACHPFIRQQIRTTQSEVAAAVLFVFFESGKCDLAKRWRSERTLKRLMWRQREKCQNTIHCQKTQFTVQLKKGETSLEKVASPKIIVLWVFSKSICEDRHLFWRRNSRRDKTIFGKLVLVVFPKSCSAEFLRFQINLLLSQALNQFTQILESDILSWFLEISIPRHQRPIGECNFGGKWGEIN